MNITVITAVISTILAMGGVCVAIIKWVVHQNRQTEEIEALKKKHDADIAGTKRKETEDIQIIKDELCVLSYAMLASLDGLKQLHCNGEVTKAHDRLEKHLNQTAHGQTRITKL